jgi:hypothetical protein
MLRAGTRFPFPHDALAKSEGNGRKNGSTNTDESRRGGADVGAGPRGDG